MNSTGGLAQNQDATSGAAAAGAATPAEGSVGQAPGQQAGVPSDAARQQSNGEHHSPSVCATGAIQLKPADHSVFFFAALLAANTNLLHTHITQHALCTGGGSQELDLRSCCRIGGGCPAGHPLDGGLLRAVCS